MIQRSHDEQKSQCSRARNCQGKGTSLRHCYLLQNMCASMFKKVLCDADFGCANHFVLAYRFNDDAGMVYEDCLHVSIITFWHTNLEMQRVWYTTIVSELRISCKCRIIVRPVNRFVTHINIFGPVLPYNIRGHSNFWKMSVTLVRILKKWNLYIYQSEYQKIIW